MPNRRWTANEQIKVGSDHGSPPSPGERGAPTQRSEKQSSNPWPGAPGAKGPGWNPGRHGFKEVKVHAYQDLADDGALPTGIMNMEKAAMPMPKPVRYGGGRSRGGMGMRRK